MGRLDVRVPTHIDSTVSYISREGRHEERVTIKELSLSGALVTGLSTHLEELFAIRPQFKQGVQVELLAKLVRQGRGGAAIRLFYSDQKAMQALWEHIRERLPQGDSCPYCGRGDGSRAGSCDDCNLYLNFASPTYLERHVENTFAQRLNIRLSRFNLEYFQKIIHFVDSKLLKLQHRSPSSEFVGTSPAMLSVFSMIRKVAPTNMSVLLLGESGTGKELTARSLHALSSRRDGPFVAVNCAAIPENLLEAELFGYEKGAFTGAYAARKGQFECADGGTLFLDEIGDLPSNLQGKLLRFLEDRLVQPVGSTLSRHIDVRIVAATNCDLEQSVARGGFRIDLFYRLNSFTIKLPPLREREEDKVRLAKYFLGRFSGGETRGVGFSPAALEAIRSHNWPGNVRELENKVRRGVLMAVGTSIEPGCMELEPETRENWGDRGAVKAAAAKREYIIKVLEENNYVIAKAARQLNISRPSMYALIKKHGIQREGGEERV